MGVAVARIAVARRHVPDVVVMDYRLAGGDGVTATRQVLAEVPAASVVMLTGQADRNVLAEALDAGVCSFLSKQAPATELVAAVRAAASGDSYFTPDVLAKLVRLRRDEARSPAGALNPREREVLQLVADGHSVAEIGRELHLSVHTVRNHLRHAMQKLGVHTKLDAVLAATRAGVIRL